MRITKFGHSCLLIEQGSVHILIDPGVWSTLPDKLQNLDAILITHEHPDHMGIEWLQKILPQNPRAVIYTNKGVGQKLAEVNIAYQLLEDGQSATVAGVLVEGFGKDHAFIYQTLPRWDNTGYLINGRLFHPGDAFTMPSKPIEILACPIAAPWSRLADVLDYGKAVAPKISFPIHDGFLKPANPYYPHLEREFKAVGIQWTMLVDGKSIEV